LLATSCSAGREVVTVVPLIEFDAAYGYTAYQKPPSATGAAFPVNVVVNPACPAAN
jgi:hypothetical protein